LLLATALVLPGLAFCQDEVLTMDFRGRTDASILVGEAPLSSQTEIEGTFIYDVGAPGTPLDAEVQTYPQIISGGFILRLGALNFETSSYFVGVSNRDPSESFVVNGVLTQIQPPGTQSPAPRLRVELTVAALDKNRLSDTGLLRLFNLLQLLDESNFAGIRIESLDTTGGALVHGTLGQFEPRVTGKPAVFLTPSTTIDFGEVPVNGSKALTGLARNFGDRDLLLAQEAVVAGFDVEPSLINNFAIIGPGSLLPLGFTFAPDVVGEVRREVSFTTTDPEVPVFAITVLGTGVELNDSRRNAPSVHLVRNNPVLLTGSTEGATAERNLPPGVWYRLPTLGLVTVDVPQPEIRAVASADRAVLLSVFREDEEKPNQYLEVETDPAPLIGAAATTVGIQWQPRRNREYLLLVHDESTSGPFEFELSSANTENPGSQLPGDCNQDANLDIGDPVCLFRFLFFGTPRELPCGDGTTRDPANSLMFDCNGDGGTDLADGVCILNFLFQGSSPPAIGQSCQPLPGCPDNCEA